MADDVKPLNGTRTHPLSQAARSVLDDLSRGPVPTSKINPGIVNRLQREGGVEIVDLPSPFKSHKGGTCPHLRLVQRAAEEASDG